VIVFTSDFGSRDWYVGAVKAVLAERAPRVPVLDLCHGVPPGAIGSAAFVLTVNLGLFPPDTVQLVVVDPGVGSTRRALALRAHGQFWVGPDNGVFAPFLAEKDLSAVELDVEKLAVENPSSTFHGRDIFAVAAARLATGDKLSALGNPIQELKGGEPWWRRTPDAILARVLWVDTFGNLITGVPSEVLREFAPTPQVRLANRTLTGLRDSFHEVARGECLLYIGSSGTLELAARDASAAEAVGIQVGAEIEIRSA